MNLPQSPMAEHSTIHMQEPMFVPYINPSLQPSIAHVMPAPTSNWSMESMPWKITKTDHIGHVMEFTAHATHKNRAMRKALLHQKRKSEFNVTETPVKQFISEEKITAHFNGLHISNDYIQHDSENIEDVNDDDELPSTSSKCFSNSIYEDYKITSKELEEKLRNANRITMCEELKKFSDEQKKVSYLPEALLHHIQKPCTALVLWQPSPISNIFNQNNENVFRVNEQQQKEEIEDYLTTDIDLSPVQQDDINDFIDTNKTCNLDLNNTKPDSMEEDL